jgi:hypothetical protein
MRRGLPLDMGWPYSDGSTAKLGVGGLWGGGGGISGKRRL